MNTIGSWNWERGKTPYNLTVKYMISCSSNYISLRLTILNYSLKKEKKNHGNNIMIPATTIGNSKRQCWFVSIPMADGSDTKSIISLYQ